ncbi:metal ABC transporter substrate-binding protein [Alteribacillus bidgolensis]|uniref:Zinc transport system substrate-binding protein n=1 Tax=Alteribacillus bidgolensis TaxID=930129 RepID=A0A1G8FYZ7_9BACI|nr:metal ABC transporter substrate-binding protein [Alteribacillus bidgolensis]SDH87315.1 zinc transport system substrate-binding protein [Alteribacillus bidgolensis]
MKKNLMTILFLGIIFIVMGSACGMEEEQETGSEKSEQKPLQIYTTLFAWEDFAKKIGGDEVEVVNLVPAGGDAHSFEPTSQTMVDVVESDAFIFNGAGMEGFAEEMNKMAQEEGVLSIEVTKDIDLRSFTDDHAHEHNHNEESKESSEEHDHGHGEVDPHIWLDPVIAVEAAENIKDALIKLRPEQKETFEENFADLKEQLLDLDKEFSEMVDAAEGHQFIVSHSAYGYWEERYGLEQIGLAGLAPSDEPSQKQLREIIETMENSGIQHVMLEKNVSSKVAEVVQDEVGAEALHLHNLASLVQEERDSGQDYFSLMKQNIDNLETALQLSGDTAPTQELSDHHEEEHEGHEHEDSHDDHDHSHD